MLKVIALDWGGVLIDNPADTLKRFCAKALDTDYENLSEQIDLHIEAFQNGIEEKEFWERCGITNVEKKVWTEAARSVFTLKESVANTISLFKENKLKMAFLSNTEKSAIPILTEKGWVNWFDTLVVSCELNQLKPNDDIYKTLIDRSRVSPDEILFIDDKEENIVGAKRNGIAAYQFIDDKGYLELIEKLNKADYETADFPELYKY
jgi:putative hydrolase of the HAD superfamily